MRDQPRRGVYVALEGIEGAGKSTVASLVAEHLRATGRSVIGVREPGGTVAGERIREILLDPDSELGAWGEALLFAAARAQLAVEQVGPALAAGTWVLSDRSVYSSLAYQGGGRRLGIDAVRAVNVPGLGDVWPDLVIILRIDPATGLERQEVPDRIGAEGVAFQRRVAEAFDAIAADESERVVAVDAGAPLEGVMTAVLAEIEQWVGPTG
jgi:dTMP kinase